jgi:DNA-binding transcriptional MerR regulator
MYPIGEFSIITRLSVKTLRYYHEEGLLIPDYIDDESGYRYYRPASAERAAVISMLRDMEFTIAEIREILTGYTDDAEVVEFLERQRGRIEVRISKYRDQRNDLDLMIETIRRSEKMKNEINHDVQEKFIDDIILAAVRYKGRYEQVGEAFQKVARVAGRFINGRAMALYHDGEYKEADADIEAGFPVKKILNHDDISCRVLAGGKAVTLIHRGGYHLIGQSYEMIMHYIADKKLKTAAPSREVYIKGPGMIFRGNPDKYLTEIQILLK